MNPYLTISARSKRGNNRAVVVTSLKYYFKNLGGNGADWHSG